MACQPNLLFNTKIKRNVICWSVALANVAKSQKRVFDVIYEDENDDYAEKKSINVVNRAEMGALMETQDVVLSF